MSYRYRLFVANLVSLILMVLVSIAVVFIVWNNPNVDSIAEYLAGRTESQIESEMSFGALYSYIAVFFGIALVYKILQVRMLKLAYDELKLTQLGGLTDRLIDDQHGAAVSHDNFFGQQQ